MILLRPLEFVNLLSKIRLLCKFISAERIHRIQDIQCCFFTEVWKNCQKHFGLNDGEFHARNECCTIAVLFFVFDEVMLSIKAAISPSLHVAIDTE